MKISFDTYTINPLDTTNPLAFYELIENNRERLIHFFPGTSASANTLEATQNYMKEVADQIKNKTYLPYIISETDTNQYVGLVDFKHMDWRIPKTEMGYLIDQHFTGKGIITQAADLVIKYAVENYNFRKILCRISPTNPGSINVAKRLGFELEGKIRNDFISPSGEAIDLHYYGMIF